MTLVVVTAVVVVVAVVDVAVVVVAPCVSLSGGWDLQQCRTWSNYM